MVVRFERTHCEWSRTRVLNGEQVRAIRQEYASGLRKKDNPHVKYGVAWDTYYKIATGRRWKRLED